MLNLEPVFLKADPVNQNQSFILVAHVKFYNNMSNCCSGNYEAEQEIFKAEPETELQFRSSIQRTNLVPVVP